MMLKMTYRMYEKRKKRKIKKRNPKIYLEPDSGPSREDIEDNTAGDEDNESGFEARKKKLCLQKIDQVI